jgi:methyl-accepting chemotaxis protein
VQRVALVAETVTALGQLVTQVGEIDGIVGKIAVSAQEQASGLPQVDTAVSQMDHVTQQDAAMVEQSTAASWSLAQDTQILAERIARFSLEGGNGPASTHYDDDPAKASQRARNSADGGALEPNQQSIVTATLTLR